MTKTTNNQNIKIAVDNCIFTLRQGKLHILLIQMKEKLTGQWALPGGLIDNKEDLESAAKRFLKDQTSLTDVYLEQLYTFSQPDRDPFGRVIATAYFALIPFQSARLKTIEKYAAVEWHDIDKLPRLAYDHTEIVRYARQRLEWKISYTNVAWSLLPAKFTLTELQKVYEAILGHELDKRNFRKKLSSLDLLNATGEQKLDGAHRPAMLYQFKSRKPEIVEMI